MAALTLTNDIFEEEVLKSDIPVLVDNANITVVRVAQGGVSYGKDEKTL